MRSIRVILVLLVATLGLSAFAQYRGGTIYHNSDTGEYCAAVKTDWFIGSASTQENENWCWAACIEMVLDYQGVYITQEEIVTSVFGWPADRGGSAKNIVDAINNSGRDIRAHYEYPSQKSKISFIDDLAKKYPLIVGLSMPGQDVGHAFVLTGITFTTDASGRTVYPRKVILRNPWPYRAGQSTADREELYWSDFISRCHTIVHVYPN